MVKNYVLDTNILLGGGAENIYGFDDNNVIITGTSLQEIDSKKTMPGDVGYNARECCRILDDLRTKGDLRRGVSIKSGGKLFLLSDEAEAWYLPSGYSKTSPDNRIINACVRISKMRNEVVILVTNDISMRVNASICGVAVEAYLNDIVSDTGYTGHTDAYVIGEQIQFPNLGIIDALYKSTDGKVLVTEHVCVTHTDDNGDMSYVPLEAKENQFITLHGGNNQSVLTMYRGGYLRLVREKQLMGWIDPLNAMQKYAMHALLAPPEEIPLVILCGPAGTAKTFLSLAAGLEQTDIGRIGLDSDSRYRKIMISRPNVEQDEGFGYLPGDLREKSMPLLSAYYDNLEVILRGKYKEETMEQISMQMEDMMDNGSIEITPLSYIRGRSIPDAYIICDEAQNARKKLIRDVITRAGDGTKVVICGDPNQIDAPTLDEHNNGLMYAMEAMEGDSTTAILRLPPRVSVRSLLARRAIEKMK